MSTNFETYEVVVANSGHGELELTDLVSSEKTIKINPGAANVRVLITQRSGTDVADIHDFLLPNGEATEFQTISGLDRLSFYNGSGGEAKISIAVFS